jgi:hypothetical protein
VGSGVGSVRVMRNDYITLQRIKSIKIVVLRKRFQLLYTQLLTKKRHEHEYVKERNQDYIELTLLQEAWYIHAP